MLMDYSTTHFLERLPLQGWNNYLACYKEHQPQLCIHAVICASHDSASAQLDLTVL